MSPAPQWRTVENQRASTLRDYVFPRLGKRSVADIGTVDVMAVFTPIWNEKPETARRVRQRISTVMKWAAAQGDRADNPAGDAIVAALPRHNGKSKHHHRALPHGEAAATTRPTRVTFCSVPIAQEPTSWSTKSFCTSTTASAGGPHSSPSISASFERTNNVGSGGIERCGAVRSVDPSLPV